MSNVCPICQKDDAIQRVAVVVQAGQSSGIYTGPSGGVTYSDGKRGSFSGYSTLSGSAASDLARLLAPPAEPQKRGISCLFWIVSGILGIAIAALLPVALLSVPAFFMELLKLVAGISSGDITGTDQIMETIFWGVLFLLPVLFCLFIIVIFYKFEKRQKIKSEILYAEEKPKWDAAIEKWNRLYFCHRDGIVFDPVNNDTCQPVQVKGFVYP